MGRIRKLWPNSAKLIFLLIEKNNGIKIMPNIAMQLPDTKRFTQRMAEYWQKQLRLVPSPALLTAWQLMAKTFNRHATQQPDKWSVFPLPTGTGKTQGLIVYCSMLAEIPLLSQPGVLIVTRFTEEADYLCEQINTLANKKIAVACHSDSDSDIKLARKSPVLIVTHSAYMLAMDEIDKQEDDKARRWGQMIAWLQMGQRRLTVIDEALNTVDTFSSEYDQIRLWRGAIPHYLATNVNHKRTVELLDEFIASYAALIERQQTQGCFLPDATGWPDLSKSNISKLAESLKDLDTAIKLYGRILPASGRKLQANVVSDTFTALKHITSSWSIYAKQGNVYMLSSAVAPLPPQLKSAVILDATASCNHVYEILGQAVNLITDLPHGMRSYGNVKLYLHYGHRVGRGIISQQSPERLVETLQGIKPQLTKSKPFLLVLHKAVERKFKKHISLAFTECQLAHWGDIDGKNSWQDLDTIVLYGLPYLGNLIPAVSVMAYSKWYDKEGNNYKPEIFDSITDEDDEDRDTNSIESRYERGHIASSLIQAINRIRCRKVIDSKGNCKPATVHLFLNRNGKRERTALSAIKKLMPGIDVIIDTSVSKKKSDKVTKSGLKVINHLRNKPIGEHRVKELIVEADISDTTAEKLIKQYENVDSPFNKQMLAIGITNYIPERGKYANRRFVKTK